MYFQGHKALQHASSWCTEVGTEDPHKKDLRMKLWGPPSNFGCAFTQTKLPARKCGMHRLQAIKDQCLVCSPVSLSLTDAADNSQDVIFLCE